jgi:hypothetical protein
MNSDGTNVTEFSSGFRASPAATGNGLYYAEETAGALDDSARYCKVTVTGARRKDVQLKLDDGEQAGVNIVRRALEEPLRWIARNAGQDGGEHRRVVPSAPRQGRHPEVARHPPAALRRG